MWYSAVGSIVTLLLSLLIAPLAVEAQPLTHVDRIGVYFFATTPGRDPFVEAFLEGMRALGYVEGQNFVLGTARRKAVRAAPRPGSRAGPAPGRGDGGETPAALAAKDATTTIPIVMAGVGDPVGSGLVASLARPGGNVTGLTSLQSELIGKELEFLKAMLPTVSRVAVLWNPANQPPSSRPGAEGGPAVGVQLHRVGRRESRGFFDGAFAAMTKAHAEALLVMGDVR